MLVRTRWTTTAAFCLLALLTVFTSGCTRVHSSQPRVEDGASPTPPAAGTAAPLAPSGDAYFGVYYGNGSIERTNASLGRVPQIHLTYFGWQDAWAIDPVLGADRARGQLSLVNWEPFDIDFRDVVAGRYDAMLTTRAQEAARLAHPVFLDFAAEMNEEEGWGGHDPALYVATWRHLHDIFSRYSNGNVVWVWAPNNTDSADAPPAMDYYPGDDYVDWTGIDGYNWGTSKPGFEWQTFHQVFADVYDDLHRLGKPIIIGETASDERGGSKVSWIDEIAPTLDTAFPDVKAVVWFDVKKERDWRISSSPASLAAVRRLVAAPILSAPVR